MGFETISETTDKKRSESFVDVASMLAEKSKTQESALRYKLIVVKVGTGVIAKNGGVDEAVMRSLVTQISRLKKMGIDVLLVTSGAVATGREIYQSSLGEELPDAKYDREEDKQIYAQIGQPVLISHYRELLGAGKDPGQLLLTKGNFTNEKERFVILRTLRDGLERGVLPIINENDVVFTQELMFTDNDELACIIAREMRADAVITLTSVDGLLDDAGELIPRVEYDQFDSIRKYIRSEKSAVGRGGMHTKISMARQLTEEGIAVHIANGKVHGTLLAIAARKAVGTEFVAKIKGTERV